VYRIAATARRIPASALGRQPLRLQDVLRRLLRADVSSDLELQPERRERVSQRVVQLARDPLARVGSRVAREDGARGHELGVPFREREPSFGLGRAWSTATAVAAWKPHTARSQLTERAAPHPCIAIKETTTGCATSPAASRRGDRRTALCKATTTSASTGAAKSHCAAAARASIAAS